MVAVDEELLESSLNLGNASWIDGLLGIADSRLGGWSWCDFWRWLNRGWLLINWADWARLFVLNSSRLGSDRLLFLDGDLQTKL